MGMKAVTIRMTDNVYSKLRELSKKQNMTINDTIATLMNLHENEFNGQEIFAYMPSEFVAMLIKHFCEENGDIDVSMALNYLFLEKLITRARVGEIPDNVIERMWNELGEYKKEIKRAKAKQYISQKKEKISDESEQQIKHLDKIIV